jgi:diacylglycerol kinase
MMRRFLTSVKYALSGIAIAVRKERNMRIHLIATAAVVLLGLWLRLSPAKWAVLLGLCGVVIGLELVNTAVERVVDLVSPERQPLAKEAKDAAAGGVLAAALFAVAAGLVLLGPPLWDKLRDLFG